MVRPGKKNTIFDILDVEGAANTAARLDEIINDLKIMLGEYKVGMYAFSELWYSRVGKTPEDKSPATGDTLTDKEIEAIKHGTPETFHQTFLCLFLLRKVVFVKNYTYTLWLGKFSEEVELPCFYVEPLVDVKEDMFLEPEFNGIKKPCFELNTVGISIGQPFAFPAILINMDQYDDRRNLFVKDYNKLVIGRMKLLSGNTTSSDPKTQKKKEDTMKSPEFIASSKTTKTAIIDKWTTLVKEVMDKENTLEDWTTDMPNFDVNTFSKGTAELCSAFTWWPNRDVTFNPMAADAIVSDDTPVSLDGENSDYALYRDRKMLIPRSAVSSFKAYKKVFSLSLKGHTHNGVFTSKSENVDVANPYKLLAAAGSQPIELSNLASILGSGCHNSAALEAIKANKNIATAIGNLKYLENYLNAMPEITHAVGTVLADVNKKALVAVEFPTYDFNPNIKGGICYSRIDAITKGYKFMDLPPDEGYAIWEYKTRWGAGPKPWKTEATEDDIIQAAYYRERFNAMTGLEAKICYIAYVQIAAPSKLDLGNVVDIELFVHRYTINEPLTINQKAE